MQRVILGLIVLIMGYAMPLNANENAASSDLPGQILAVLQSEEEQANYLEDILRRKNTEYRKSIAALIEQGDTSELTQQLVAEQIHVMESLLVHSDKQAQRLLDEALTSEVAQQAEVYFYAQQRISAADTYTQELAQTFEWADTLGMDTDKSNFIAELQMRAKGLSDLILFLDERKQGLVQLAKLTPAEEVAEVDKQQLVVSQMQQFMLISLNVTVGLLEGYQQDVTSYKQLLFTLTGDINSDILDVNVAWGLLSQWLDAFQEWALENTPSMVMKLLVFVLILWITRAIAKLVANIVRRSVSHSKMKFSILMQEFFISMASKAVTFIGVLVALSQLGINLGPLLTGFGVAGVIIGFALQDTLSNFASGMMILIYRPFDVRDLVQVAGIKGTVSHMSLVSTTVRTLDNQTLVIPNNKIWGDVINNMTAETERRVDMVFGIAYDDNFDDAKQIINQVLGDHKLILPNPEPIVRVHTLNESSVDIVVRPWVKTDDYWDVYFDITEEVKRQFDAKGITIPFPQRDVHIYNQKGDVAATGEA